MIKFEQVTFQYEGGESGVYDLQFTIPEGTCTIFCGRSGHGKSTILRLLMGLIPNFYAGKLKGRITVFGKEPSTFTAEERAALMGVVFQDPRSQFFMSKVQDEILFAAENLGCSKESMVSGLALHAEELHVNDLLEKDVQSLSSGEKQRVAIAAATFLKPTLLILDEPTANLDVQTIQVLLDTLMMLKQSGTTIIISDHRLFSYRDLADRFIVLNEGQVAMDNPCEQFLTLPDQTFIQYGLRFPNIRKNNLAEKDKQVAPNSLLVKDVQYMYKKNKKGFQHFQAQAQSGQVVAITGANGTGKTTLCKVLAGLYRQQKGQIFFNNKELSPSQRTKRSYFVMQDPDYQLYAESVGDEMVLGRPITETLRQKSLAALTNFSLTHVKDRHPASLSGGEKQRVTLAAASVADAQIILLDEPTSGLDGANMINVARWVRHMANQNKFVFVITHDQDFIDIVCDDVWVLE